MSLLLFDLEEEPLDELPCELPPVGGGPSSIFRLRLLRGMLATLLVRGILDDAVVLSLEVDVREAAAGAALLEEDVEVGASA